jgi:hypothetical protein
MSGDQDDVVTDETVAEEAEVEKAAAAEEWFGSAANVAEKADGEGVPASRWSVACGGDDDFGELGEESALAELESAEEECAHLAAREARGAIDHSALCEKAHTCGVTP